MQRPVTNGEKETYEKSAQVGIPPSRSQREELLRIVRGYVESGSLSSPLSQEELDAHARAVLSIARTDEEFLPFLEVLLNNETWRDVLGGIPYDRRLLLLPQCLRDESQCSALVDEYGLLCKHCGRCVIHEFLTEAEQLGYVTLVAEGTVVVTSLIESGRIEAVVGASCLSSLERIFSYVEAWAFPGIAIPLLYDGCRNTALDVEWLREAIHLNNTDRAPSLDFNARRREVDSWFEPEALDEILGPPSGETERIARRWLAQSGKRWRPFLAACTFHALRGAPDGSLSDEVRRIATAVECFHKASLVHDDIEDNDEMRYGEKTLHERYGVPVALNVGDFLVGEGYRLIAEAELPDPTRANMLLVAAHAHRDLCIGQGAELCWMRRPRVLRSDEVIEIYAKKTAPAFEVALRLGAVLAGSEEDLCNVFHEYCHALGIAYQIRDDREDMCGTGSDECVLRPSLLLTVAYEQGSEANRKALASLWDPSAETVVPEELARILAHLQVEAKVLELLEEYKRRAIRSLSLLKNPHLKGLLRRVVTKIFDDLDTRELSLEFEAGHASGGGEGADVVA